MYHVNWIAEKPKDWDGDVAIILAHGAGQGMDSPFMNFFHTELARRGYLSVKFNFNYVEKGRKIPDRLPDMQARYRQIVEEVAAAFTPRRIVIGGKSMGGRVASTISDARPGLSGLIFLGYPLHPPGKPEQMRDAHLYAIDVPMLFISGTRDTLAQQDLLQKVMEKLASRATMRWIEEGNHSLEIRRSGTRSWPGAIASIDEWLKTI